MITAPHLRQLLRLLPLLKNSLQSGSSWCDGEPYAYHWGLVAARKHLAELGAAEPAMPPFDESKYEPMPEVEINPDDEFHVDV